MRAIWSGDAAAAWRVTSAATPSSRERADLECRSAVPVDEALAGLGERVGHREGAVAEHDAHALRGCRPGDVVQQAKARVISVVDVVDGEQKPVRRGREAHELADRDEETLVRAASRPGHRRASERTVDLHPMVVSEPVEQRGVPATHVRQRLDDRCVGPRSLDWRRGASADAEAQLPPSTDDGIEQRRLADAGRPADDQRAASAGGRVEQGALRDLDLLLASDQGVVLADRDLSLGQQAIPQRDCLASGSHAELTAHRPIHPLELAERRMPVAVGRVPAHECEMGDLVARVDLDDGLPPAVELEQVEVAEPQLLATVLRPVFVAVVGEQLTEVEGEGGAGCDDVVVGEGAPSDLLELHDVHRGVGLGGERDDVASEDDRVRHVDRLAGEVRRFVQLGCRLVHGVVGPQQVEHLFAVQTQRRSQCEHLDQRGSVAPSPMAVCNGGRVDSHTEVTEHRDGDRRHGSVVGRARHGAMKVW